MLNRTNNDKASIAVRCEQKRCKLSTVTKQTKKHWRKPKSMPKRPLSAYNLFFAEERRRLVNAAARAGYHAYKHPKLGFAGLARTIAANWKKLDAAKRQELERQSEKDRQRYRLLIKEWKRKKALAEGTLGFLP